MHSFGRGVSLLFLCGHRSSSRSQNFDIFFWVMLRHSPGVQAQHFAAQNIFRSQEKSSILPLLNSLLKEIILHIGKFFYCSIYESASQVFYNNSSSKAGRCIHLVSSCGSTKFLTVETSVRIWSVFYFQILASKCASSIRYVFYLLLNTSVFL